VIDYRVSFAAENDIAFTIFSASIAETSVTVTGLEQGVTYNLIVESRNVIGYSPVSSSVTILAA
jgi:hypothetical protein